MGRIPYETAGFSGAGSPPTAGDLDVSMPHLFCAAATVGATPVALSAAQRPLIEVCWRIALVAATLDDGTYWNRSDAYDRLDPSEKRAISYFLGMNQAKLTSEMLLGVSHLVHVDAMLAVLGHPPTNRSRPDLVGFDFATRQMSLSVEAKGRTRGWDRKVVDTAKSQAAALPSVLSTTSSLRVASLAYFQDRVWWSYLEDPEGFGGGVPVTPELVLVSYYLPLVRAVLTDGVVQAENSDNDRFAVLLPDLDMVLGLPRTVLTILQDMPSSGPVPSDQITLTGAKLRVEVARLSANTIDAPVGDEALSSGADRTAYTGVDGISIELGASWTQAERTRLR